MKLRYLLIFIALIQFSWSIPSGASSRVNIVAITVDDMNADSVGAFGSRVPDATPHIDTLASHGFRFENAHVPTSICKPSRNSMWTGLYPHQSGVEAFYPSSHENLPHITSILRKAGYLNILRGKVGHSTPNPDFTWDVILGERTNLEVDHRLRKAPETYGQSTRRAIELARKEGKPLFYLVNVHDPHKPFYSADKHGNPAEDPYHPSHIYSPGEVEIPGFLFEDDRVRALVAKYYSSVRRADDAVGEILKAIHDSGWYEKTLVIFLSDHGMAFPFAKSQLYHHSTRTPLIIRWPGNIRAGSYDADHMISTVDLLPTILDILDIPQPAKLPGRSFFPVLNGEQQDNRDYVFKGFYENIFGQRAPMRAVQSKRYLYVYNAWAKKPIPPILRPLPLYRSRLELVSEGYKDQLYRRMKHLSRYDKDIAHRYYLLRYRTPEELYDIQSDPNCLENLVENTGLEHELDDLRDALTRWMQMTNDPLLQPYLNRHEPEAVDTYIAEKQREAHQRKLAQKSGWEHALATKMLEMGILTPDGNRPEK